MVQFFMELLHLHCFKESSQSKTKYSTDRRGKSKIFHGISGHSQFLHGYLGSNTPPGGPRLVINPEDVFKIYPGNNKHLNLPESGVIVKLFGLKVHVVMKGKLGFRTMCKA